MILLLLGCVSGDADSGLDCDARATPVDYGSFGQGFLDAYCVACHSSQMAGSDRLGAPEDVNLDTFSDAQLWADRIWARTAEPEVVTMPPGGGPTDDDLDLLREWLVCDMGVVP